MFMKNSKRKTFMQTVKQNCSTGDKRAVLEVMSTSVQHNNYEGEDWVVSDGGRTPSLRRQEWLVVFRFFGRLRKTRYAAFDSKSPMLKAKWGWLLFKFISSKTQQLSGRCDPITTKKRKVRPYPYRPYYNRRRKDFKTKSKTMAYWITCVWVHEIHKPSCCQHRVRLSKS